MKTRLSKGIVFLVFVTCLLLVNRFSSYFTACSSHQQSFDFFSNH